MVSRRLPKGVELTIPLTKGSIERLQPGDVVYITGDVWSCRENFFIRTFDENQEPPIDTTRRNVMMVASPYVARRGKTWIAPVSGPIPTTGIRYAKWVPRAIEHMKLRAVVSKDGMGTHKETIATCRRFGCVTLAVFGFPPKVIGRTCNSIREVHWLDLGATEALWVFDVKRQGPFIVNIDTHSNCYFEALSQKIDANLMQVHERMALADFRYTEI
jgi:L(+)-tartrate dehydratase beta subunit